LLQGNSLSKDMLMTHEPNRSKYLITLSYDGSSFAGWQVQPNGVTIQGVLQEVLSQLIGESIYIVGSGRTDAGVHAKKQTAHFTTTSPLSPFFLARANRLLPPEIRLLSLESVSTDFHARFHTVQKTYAYHITTAAVLSPFESRFRTHLFYKMDLSLLQEGLSHFIGTHDFSSFANQRGAPFSPIKTLHQALYISEGHGRFRLEFTGDGFLYKMVRNIVGTLIYIARGKLLLEELPRLFELKDRKQAPPPAPPQGLFLVSVDYPTKQRTLLEGDLL
jgi:tRNA pseudouridine38-40 synthase